MVPTPRAVALREQVRQSVEAAVRLLQPTQEVDLATLERQFNLHANDTFTGAFGGLLLEHVRRESPHSVLRFQPESDTEDDVLRDGKVDLYISAMRQMGAEIHVQPLFTTTFVGLAREDHPIFDDEITPEQFASYDQISVSRRGRTSGPIDTALATLGLKRTVSLVVPTFHSAVFALSSSDLILPLPEHVVWTVRKMGVRARPFALPIPLETVVIVQAWHPRFHHDPAHQWLRRVIRAMCTETGSA